MSQPTLESFFSGGGKSFSWKDKPIGTTIAGTILAVHPPQQQTDPATSKPAFWPSGDPKMAVRIDIATNERDPQDPEDDGSRALYVQGKMPGAIGDALRKAGRKGPPEVGGQLAVTLIERTPNDNPALNPINKFAAQYTSPAAQATAQYFGNGQGQAPPQYAQPAPLPPQQTVMQPPPQQQFVQPVAIPAQQPAYAGAPAPQPVMQAPPEPPRPAAISEQAWAAMDPVTKVSVAQTMSNIPPF